MQSQHFAHFDFVSDSVQSYQVKFKEINNLVLIPLSFNGSDTLYFILDSGAENITLFGAEFNEPPVDTTRLRQVNVAGGGSISWQTQEDTMDNEFQHNGNGDGNNGLGGDNNAMRIRRCVAGL